MSESERADDYDEEYDEESTTSQRDIDKVQASILRERLIRTEGMLDAQRDETVGLWRQRLDISKSAKQLVLSMSEHQTGIINSAKSLSKLPTPPYNLIAGIVIAVALVYMFTVNPELGIGLGRWVEQGSNKVIILAMIVFGGLISYVSMNKSRKK